MEPTWKFQRGDVYFVRLELGIRALHGVHPMDIYRTGQNDPAKLPGWKKYVFPIYMAYNGKGRKDTLPMKF